MSRVFDEFEADEYRGATVCGTDVDTRRNCIYVHNGETSDLYTLDIERWSRQLKGNGKFELYN